MAADKTHLRNTDKSYKLKKTDKKTTEGNTIYLNTETGEEHSEISVTLEYPENSGKWINVPSLLNGRVYNAKGVLAMLKKGKLVPTSTHMDEQTAVEAAVYRSTTLQSNTGTTLKPSNEINLVKSQSARITEQEAPGLIEEVNNAEEVASFASTFPTEAENPNGLFVRAEQPAYTSGSGANADILAAAEAAMASDQQTQRLGAIMDNQALEKQDDYYQYYPNSARNTDPNFSGTPQPERISDRATQYLEPEGSARAARERAIGRTMESYGNRTGGVNPLDENTLMAEGSPNGRGIDYSREYISPFQNMVDLSNIESLTDNGAPGSEFDVNKRMGAAMSSYGERIGEDKYRENLMNNAMQAYGERTGMSTGAAAAIERNKQSSLNELAAIMDRADAEKIDPTFFDASKSKTNIFGNNSFNDRNSIGQMLRGQGIVGDRRAIQNKDYGMTTSAADQAMFDAAYKQRNFPDAGPKTRQSKPEPITGSASAMDDSADIEAGMSTNYMMTDGPDRRQSNKPEFKFEYKPHMNPEQKMKDNRNIKGLTPAYGEMPGFKKAENGNYWSADENSGFWKTDAGYEKAQQTWGRSGGTLPNYVKRPKRKELDVEAIKNFFTPKASGY